MRPYLSLLILLLLTACQDSKKNLPSEEKPSLDKVVNVTPEGLKITSVSRVCSASIRGLHILDDQTGWASGSGGTVLRMTDGANWVAQTIEGYTHLDFRDIHGFNAMTAVAMAAGEEGRMIWTGDGGTTWIEVYTNLEEGIFLDGIDFDGNVGYCIGDPLDGKPLILRSEDTGLSWSKANPETIGVARNGEGSYAASGTTIVYRHPNVYAAYGGKNGTRVLINNDPKHDWNAVEAPLRTGEGCGIFSMAFQDNKHGVAVGGCYLDSMNTKGHCAMTTDAGKSWTEVTSSSPAGYRSCVAYAQQSDFYLACGRTGIDISTDGGHSWLPVSEEGYYSSSLAGSSGWLMGRNGRMAHINW